MLSRRIGGKESVDPRLWGWGGRVFFLSSWFELWPIPFPLLFKFSNRLFLLLEYFCGKSWKNFQSLGGTAWKFGSSDQTASTHPFGKWVCVCVCVCVCGSLLLIFFLQSYLSLALFPTFPRVCLCVCYHSPLIFPLMKTFSSLFVVISPTTEFALKLFHNSKSSTSPEGFPRWR